MWSGISELPGGFRFSFFTQGRDFRTLEKGRDNCTALHRSTVAMTVLAGAATPPRRPLEGGATASRAVLGGGGGVPGEGCLLLSRNHMWPTCKL